MLGTFRLLAACIRTHNVKVRAQRLAGLDTTGTGSDTVSLAAYSCQLVPVINPQGEKQVWVNGFCQAPPAWRTHLFLVDDGGDCYFNVMLNLTQRKWGELSFNGEA